MRTLKHLLFLGTVLVTSLSFADITAIHSFSEANDMLDRSDNETLVVFDVDDVLIISDDFIFRPGAAGFNPTCWKDKDRFGKDAEEINHLISILQKEMDFVLIEPTIPDLIEGLQKKGAKTIALTACRTGKFGVIESVENWRVSQLLENRIDFGPSWKETSDLSFPSLVSSSQNPPVFKRGILLLGDFYHSKESTKGKLLGHFFDQVQWQPKKVLFFDDMLNNLTAVQEEMKNRGIEYHGFLYKGVEILPGEFDKELAEFQLEHLTKHKKWLKDRQAKELLLQRERKDDVRSEACKTIS